jgi:hypothetical protein
LRYRVSSPDRVEAKGRQSSVCLAQEALDTLSVTSSGGPKVFQALLGDDQLLHLSLHQLPLPGRQFYLRSLSSVSRASALSSRARIWARASSRASLLLLKVGLTAVEAGLAGAQDLELSPEGDVVQLLPLLQQPLQLFHLPLLLVDLACARSKVLLLLGDGAGLSLG